MPGADGRVARTVAPVIAVLPPPGAPESCPICDQQGYIVVKGEHARAQRCSCLPVTCPACQGVGWMPSDPANPRSARRPCDCRSLGARIARFDDARIPGRHAKPLSSWSPTTNEQRTLLMQLNDVVENWSPDTSANRGLVLYGPVGRGKTHLMCGLLRELVFVRGVTARFVEFSHLLADLKQNFASGEGAGTLITELAAVEVLAIDELGKGHGTDYEGTVIEEIVSRRYNAERPTFATTNYLRGEPTGIRVPNFALGPEYQPRLADRVGDRVYSRLVETCDFVEVTGRDHRRKDEPHIPAPRRLS